MDRPAVRVTRIAPLSEPWPDWFGAAMSRTMPPGMAPLMLFRTIATSPRAWEKFSAASLLDKGPLSLRDREIVIDRTTAICGCGYEWGVHAAPFADRAGLSAEPIEDTTAETIDPALWSEQERTLIGSVDALIDGLAATLGFVVRGFGDIMRFFQTGNVRNYALMFFIGVIVFVAFFA
jgi:alkylhydroperoxidase family enzyme